MKKIITTVIAACLSAILISIFLTSCGEKHTHEFGAWMTAKAATCTEEGTEERYCYCLEKETRAISASMHTPEENGSCTQAQRCTVCGTVLRMPVAHKYGAFVVIDPGTCYDNGYQEQTCTVCGDVSGKTIYSKGHVFGDWVTVKEATCEEPGLKERYCVCGEKKSEDVIVEHTGSWTVVKEPSKTENGSRELDCSVCHKKITEVLYAFGSSGLAYQTHEWNKTCTITGIGTCTDTDVVIPENINGYTVVAIATRAFEYCSSITSLSIPSTVTMLGEWLVSRASKLTTLYYNPSVTCDASCFMNAPIQKIVYGGTVVFKITTTVEEVVITGNATAIDAFAFSDCLSLKSIVIPDSVTAIGERAFSNCNSLTEITLPQGLTTLDNNAFYACHSLKTIVIPEGVTTISDMAFYACNRLTSVILPSTVTKIENSAFSGCSSLKEITIPEGVKEISSYAFSSCTSLTCVLIPADVTVIAEGAFMYCTSLKEISLPAGLQKVKTNAFFNCSALENIAFGGTKAEWEAIPKEKDWKTMSLLKTVTCNDGTVSVK